MKNNTAEEKPDQEKIPSRIVIKFQEKINIPHLEEKEILKYFLKYDLIPWHHFEELFPGIKVSKLFSTVKPAKLDELVKRAKEADHTYRSPNFHAYFAIDSPLGIDEKGLLGSLRKLKTVEAVYIEGEPTPPPSINASDDPRCVNQNYLDAADTGIDARYAWTVPGGDGVGAIRFIDIEQGWALNLQNKADHEDLPDPASAAAITLLSGVNKRYRDHGTAVLGVIFAQDNNIGCVGITPFVKADTVSQWRSVADSHTNTAEAILDALTFLSLGDVLLIEAQTNNNGATPLVPVEVELAVFDAIRLGTTIGIVIIEAGGNGNMDLDTYQDSATSQFVLNRNSTDFKDSGAILVGAAGSIVPHVKVARSNYGSRIDCYAWGENINTTWYDGSLGDTDSYTPDVLTPNGFGLTSGASAIIAGAAISVESMVEAVFQFRYSPRQLRKILSNPVNGTASATSATDPTPATNIIGVMPDLRKIKANILGLTSDIYIRDKVGDIGNPQSGNISQSPDIIVLQNELTVNPQIFFGEGSGREDDDLLSDPVVSGRDHYIYLRTRNRGQINDANVTARIYWAQPATLLTPDLWNFIGNINFPNVPAGSILTVSNSLRWPAANVPPTGHYCFISIVESLDDPMPGITNLNDLLDWNNFYRLIGNNNNIGWRNFNVVMLMLASGDGFAEMEFMSPGAPEEEIKMALEIGTDLPENSKVILEVPLQFFDLLQEPSSHIEINKHKKIALITIKYGNKHFIGEIVYPAGARFKMKIFVNIPKEYRKYDYEIFVRQLFKEKEVGRVTWRLRSQKKKHEQRKK